MSENGSYEETARKTVNDKVKERPGLIFASKEERDYDAYWLSALAGQTGIGNDKLKRIMGLEKYEGYLQLLSEIFGDNIEISAKNWVRNLFTVNPKLVYSSYLRFTNDKYTIAGMQWSGKTIMQFFGVDDQEKYYAFMGSLLGVEPSLAREQVRAEFRQKLLSKPNIYRFIASREFLRMNFKLECMQQTAGDEISGQAILELLESYASSSDYRSVMNRIAGDQDYCHEIIASNAEELKIIIRDSLSAAGITSQNDLANMNFERIKNIPIQSDYISQAIRGQSIILYTSNPSQRMKAIPAVCGGIIDLWGEAFDSASSGERRYQNFMSYIGLLSR